MLTVDNLKKIEKSGIIPDHLLELYLADKLLVAPVKSTEQVEEEAFRFKTMYADYKANMAKAQKASHKANGYK